MRRRILGVDFSGAKDAHNKTWIADGRLRGQRLVIDGLASVATLFGERGPENVCKALRDVIAAAGAAAVGVDAPFGLAREAAGERTWRALMSAIAKERDAETFRRRYGLPERRRETDKTAKTPFAPGNLRLFRQSYFAMAHLAAPLIAKDRARFPPMQAIHPRKPIMLETCPASRLKARGLYGASYKGAGDGPHAGRMALIDVLTASGVGLSEGVKAALRDDPGGDALDAVLCCLIAADVVRSNGLTTMATDPFNVEAQVFF